MADDANVQAVKRAYEAFQRGDIPALLQMVTDDVDWELHGPPVIPFAGKMTGRQQAAEFFRKLAETQDTLEFTPNVFYADQNAVIVLGRYRGRVRATGRDTESEWVQIFTMRDGLIAGWHEFLDTASIVDAYRTPHVAATT